MKREEMDAIYRKIADLHAEIMRDPRQDALKIVEAVDVRSGQRERFHAHGATDFRKRAVGVWVMPDA